MPIRRPQVPTGESPRRPRHRYGTRPANAGDLYRDSFTRDDVIELFDGDYEQFRSSVALASEHSATERLEGTELQQIPFIVANGAATYLAAIGEGEDLATLVATLAPPFEKFWVEFELTNDVYGLRAAGVLISVLHTPDKLNPSEPDDAWVLRADIVGEWDKGKPVGPLCSYIVPLNERGFLVEHKGVFASPLTIEGANPGELEGWPDALNRYLFAALFAVSLMHCKNVSLETVEPPPKVSAKHRRRYGKPLVTYRVLDATAMTRTLETEGDRASVGLKQALHLCRGHFKTYTAEAPLFGKYTGDYWWADQVRGDSTRGRAEKDYSVDMPDGGL